MSKQPTISSVASGFSSGVTLNANFVAIQESFSNTVSRDGSTPNQMEADFDLNSNSLLNVKNTYTEYLYLNGEQVSASTSLTSIPAGLTLDTFVGDGSTVAFTLSQGLGSNTSTFVYINGVHQHQTAFNLSTTTLTFTEAPANEDDIEVRSINLLDLGEAASTQVSYTPAGSGAVERTAKSKFDDMPSVQDFGAVGGGVTDDTAAFTAAWAASDPVAVYVPAGSYKITGTVTGKFFSFGVATVVTGTVTSITNLVP